MPLKLPGGFELSIRRPTRAARAVPGGRGTGGWVPIIREPFTGAWQRNLEITNDTALSYAPVFTCVDLLSSDCSKLRWRLVEMTGDGIWLEVDNPAYSPLLRRPNRYQVALQFVQQWMVSKLVHGNTYVLKQRDQRGVVAALYVLDPLAVTPLITDDGGVYYQLTRGDLTGLHVAELPAIPASEILHDRMFAPFHPLCGVSPIYAAALPTAQGLAIERNSEAFFSNGSQPSGVLLFPGHLKQEQAEQKKAAWEAGFTGANSGRIAVLTDGVKYEPLSVNAVDAQLIDQLKWTAEQICSVYHVPQFLAGYGTAPPYAQVEPLLQLYYSEAVQRLLVSAEQVMDLGLEFPRTTLGTEFDADDLIWLNAEARGKAAAEGIGSGALAPNEARKKYYSLPPVKGGATPYLQVQNYSLAALAERDADEPFAKPAPGPPPADDDELDDEAISDEAAAALRAWWRASG